MISTESLENLPRQALHDIGTVEIDCEGIECVNCPFWVIPLPRRKMSTSCAFAYSKRLYNKLYGNE